MGFMDMNDLSNFRSSAWLRALERHGRRAHMAPHGHGVHAPFASNAPVCIPYLLRCHLHFYTDDYTRSASTSICVPRSEAAHGSMYIERDTRLMDLSTCRQPLCSLGLHARTHALEWKRLSRSPFPVRSAGRQLCFVLDLGRDFACLAPFQVTPA
jgi:hypothetical protein